jgi:hypothetical protein
MMAISPDCPNLVLAAASTDGILMSEDAGDHWTPLADQCPLDTASLIAFSPGGEYVVAGSLQGEVWAAATPKGPWQSVAIPGGTANQGLALAIDDNGRLKAVMLDRARAWLSVWEGIAGQFEQILSRSAMPNPVVRLWLPPYGGSDRTWYASLDHQVWEFRRAPADEGEGSISANLIFETDDGDRVLALTRSQIQTGVVLFACTGRTIYRSTGKRAWQAVHYFGDELAIALALSSSYPDDATAFALLLGGSFCHGILKYEEH